MFLYRKKDKIAHCVSVTDMLCSQGLKNSPESAKYLAMAMEMFFTLVDDQGYILDIIQHLFIVTL